ncbi:MAG: scpB [Thermoleophilia bacterium]|nr:scpB [Thermoleophilia bacterium]
MSDTEETNVVTLRPRAVQPSDAEVAELHEAAGNSMPPDGPLTTMRPTTTLRAQVRDVTESAVDAPLEHQLEALLFVSPTPLTTNQLADLTDQDEEDLHECLVDMMHAWGEGARGIVLERVAGGWAFRASDRCREQLKRLVRPQGDSRLSPSALETLAIVAYLQPVSRPDIAKIRGVSVDAAMTGLLERGLVEEAGRGESGAVLFRTTAHFERAFGLASLGALPPIEGFGPGDDELERMREQLEKMASARME